MPELWGPILGVRPSPLEPPFDVVLGDETHTFVEDRPLVIASSIATMDWSGLVPGMITDWERVADRLDDDDDPLTDIDVEVAGCVAATRLCSVGEGLVGWRRSVWLCSSIIVGWEYLVGAFLEHGVDPSVDPLWKSCGLLWRLAVIEGDEDTRKDREAKLSRRLPTEMTARRSSVSGEAPFDRKAMTRAFLAKAGGGGKAGTERIAATRRQAGPGVDGVKANTRAGRRAAAKTRALERRKSPR